MGHFFVTEFLSFFAYEMAIQKNGKFFENVKKILIINDVEIIVGAFFICFSELPILWFYTTFTHYCTLPVDPSNLWIFLWLHVYLNTYYTKLYLPLNLIRTFCIRAWWRLCIFHIQKCFYFFIFQFFGFVLLIK